MKIMFAILKFQSTQPEWAATDCYWFNICAASYFNPRSPNGLRRFGLRRMPANCRISIHAARMGCDRHKLQQYYNAYDFNPRSPNGLRLMNLPLAIWPINFNPRSPNGLRPLWSAPYACKLPDFNPRSPNGLRPKSAPPTPQRCDFNPRSPNGLRLLIAARYEGYGDISIHAARMGCDQ